MFNEKARITHEIDLHVVRMARNGAGGGSGMNYIEVKAEFEKCEWSRESDDVWGSDCGLYWEFDNEETPKANNMNYCPQCGKILEEAPECWEEEG